MESRIESTSDRVLETTTQKRPRNTHTDSSTLLAMRSFVLFVVFAIAVLALPVEITVGNHLDKRAGAMDDVLAEFLKAAITFGLYLWGGGIIAKRGVNYYFKRLSEYEEKHAKGTLIAMARHQDLTAPELVDVKLGDD